MVNYRRNRIRNQRGIILIITLWILVILSSVALTYAYYAQLDLQMTTYSTDSARARYLAKAGFYRTCILLRDDKLKDKGLLDNDDLVEIDDDDEGYEYDAFSEEWFSSWVGKKGELKDVEMENGVFRVEVSDESGKINLNVAAQQTFMDLLMVTGVEEEEAQLIAAAIVDWKDDDEEPSDGGERKMGDLLSEDTYYNPDQSVRDIENHGPAYVNKNAPFVNVEELLMVYKMTPYILFGEDANGNGKLDSNERDGNKNPPDDNGDNKLLLGIEPYVTVYSQNKLNINTAPQKVLETVLMSVDQGDAEDLAERIVRYRIGNDRQPGTRDDRPLRSLRGDDGDDFDLSKVRGLDEEGLYNAFLSSYPMGVSSDVFMIVSTGEVNGVERQVKAIVRRYFVEPVEQEGKDTAGRLGDRDDKQQPEIVRLYTMVFDEQGI